MTLDHIAKLAAEYLRTYFKGVIPQRNTSTAMPDRTRRDAHLAWMCGQLTGIPSSGDRVWSVRKAATWLGFIQSGLWLAGRASIDALREDNAEPLYLIWSGERSSWWGPNRGGYRQFRANAGRYIKAEAERIARGCGPEKQIALVPENEEDQWAGFMLDQLPPEDSHRLVTYLQSQSPPAEASVVASEATNSGTAPHAP